MTGNEITVSDIRNVIQGVKNGFKPDELPTAEIELRVDVPYKLFYKKCDAAVKSSELLADSVTSSITQTYTSDVRGAKVRSEYCSGGCCFTQTVNKRRVIQKPQDYACKVGRLRLDVQTETITDIQFIGGYRRDKERVSFRLKCAPNWRADFTRVEAAENNKKTRQFEIELELDNRALIDGIDSLVLAQEAYNALEVLTII